MPNLFILTSCSDFIRYQNGSSHDLVNEVATQLDIKSAGEIIEEEKSGGFEAASALYYIIKSDPPEKAFLNLRDQIKGLSKTECREDILGDPTYSLRCIYNNTVHITLSLAVAEDGTVDSVVGMEVVDSSRGQGRD